MNELKKLWKYARPYKYHFVGIIIAALIMSACTASLSAVVKYLFDEVFEKKRSEPALIICISVVALYLVHGLSRFIHTYFLRMISEKIANSIRLDIQRKYMNSSLTYHSKNNSGALMSKIVNDVGQMHYGFTKVTDVVKEPFLIILAFGWLLYIDWKLTAIIMLSVPSIFLILKQLGKGARKYTLAQQESMEDVTSTYKETLDGIRVIQSFNLEETATQRLGRNLKNYLSLRSKVLLREESAGPISEFIASITVAAVLYYASVQIISGEKSLGAIMSYFTALAILQAPVKILQEAFIRLQGMIASAQRVFQILEADSRVPELASPKPFPKDWDSIQFQNISFQYEGSFGTLKNINLEVKRGQVIAIVGESGSGKSTLVNLLERFYEPTQGKILIGSTPINEISLKDLRTHIALVTQDVFLFNESIEQNIQYGNLINPKYTIEEAAELANAKDFIEKTDQKFLTLAGDRGTRLSGGEKQRISIARAIYKDAPILILDEATSALDSQSEQEVQKGLEHLTKGRTVFVIAHRLSTITNADRIIVMKNGEICEEGTHETLIAQKGHYYKFHQLQS